jgi:uncharacterized damage-inducible protein DinB
MSIQTLLNLALKDTRFQVDQVFEGIDENLADLRCLPKAQSPRETLEHLCEACHALILFTQGKDYQWGTYHLQDKSLNNLRSTYSQLRSEVESLASKVQSEEKAIKFLDYITNHESYHVGQLCLMRMQSTPSWDPYLIYSFYAESKAKNEVNSDSKITHETVNL